MERSATALVENHDTGDLGNDIRQQSRNTLEKIKHVLAEAGTSLNNVLIITSYLTKREDLKSYNLPFLGGEVKEGTAPGRRLKV